MPSASDHADFAKAISRISPISRGRERNQFAPLDPILEPQIVQPPMRWKSHSPSRSGLRPPRIRAKSAGRSSLLGVMSQKSSILSGSAFCPASEDGDDLNTLANRFHSNMRRLKAFNTISSTQHGEGDSPRSLAGSVKSLPVKLTNRTRHNSFSGAASVAGVVVPTRLDDVNNEDAWLLSELQKRADEEIRARKEAERVISADRRRLQRLEQQLDELRGEKERLNHSDSLSPIPLPPAPTRWRSADSANPRSIEPSFDVSIHKSDFPHREESPLGNELTPHAAEEIDTTENLDAEVANLQNRLGEMEEKLHEMTEKLVLSDRQRDSYLKDLKVTSRRFRTQEEQLKQVMAQCEKLHAENEKLLNRSKILRKQNVRLEKQLETVADHKVYQVSDDKNMPQDETPKVSGLQLKQITGMVNKIHTQAKAAVDAALADSERHKQRAAAAEDKGSKTAEQIQKLEEDLSKAQQLEESLRADLRKQSETLVEGATNVTRAQEGEREAKDRCLYLEKELKQSIRREERLRQALVQQSQSLAEMSYANDSSRSPISQSIKMMNLRKSSELSNMNGEDTPDYNDFSPGKRNLQLPRPALKVPMVEPSKNNKHPHDGRKQSLTAHSGSRNKSGDPVMHPKHLTFDHNSSEPSDSETEPSPSSRKDKHTRDQSPVSSSGPLSSFGGNSKERHGQGSRHTLDLFEANSKRNSQKQRNSSSHAPSENPRSRQGSGHALRSSSSGSAPGSAQSNRRPLVNPFNSKSSSIVNQSYNSIIKDGLSYSEEEANTPKNALVTEPFDMVQYWDGKSQQRAAKLAELVDSSDSSDTESVKKHVPSQQSQEDYENGMQQSITNPLHNAQIQQEQADSSQNQVVFDSNIVEDQQQNQAKLQNFISPVENTTDGAKWATQIVQLQEMSPEKIHRHLSLETDTEAASPNMYGADEAQLKNNPLYQELEQIYQMKYSEAGDENHDVYDQQEPEQISDFDKDSFKKMISENFIHKQT